MVDFTIGPGDYIRSYDFPVIDEEHNHVSGFDLEGILANYIEGEVLNFEDRFGFTCYHILAEKMVTQGSVLILKNSGATVDIPVNGSLPGYGGSPIYGGVIRIRKPE